MKELINLKGVGPKTKQYLQTLGINTIEDLICFFPRDYELFEEPTDIIKLEAGKVATVRAVIVTKPNVFKKNRSIITSIWIGDETGRIRAYWFNSPFINKSLKVRESKVFRGKVGRLRDGIALTQSRIYDEKTYLEFEGTLSPIYHLTKGLKNNLIKKIIRTLLGDKSLCQDIFEEYLPENIVEKRKLKDLSFAFEHIHFPHKLEDMKEARKRLVYDEFFMFSLAMLENKNQKEKEGRLELKSFDKGLLDSYIEKLPFKLTKCQEKTLADICSDLKQGKKMNRLIEGDVGSGKTIVAILTAYLVANKSIQTAFMAPTEILAEQHYNTIKNLSIDKKINIGLLTGSTKENDRKIILEKLKNGEIDILIGTHALFSKDVIYKNLGLLIIDEQHRFGVNQRKQLEEKSNNANVIIMSATPIPRTLAILLYSDMDISRIEDKPKNRLPIKNYIANINEREKAYRSMKKQIDLGHQAYVICPAIEKEDDEEVGSFADFQNVKDYADRLKQFYGNEVRVEILHGKMSADEKYDVMKRFKESKIDILVSTTVVEVGVDVPNATFMIIEDAGQFGLATLHQLRGRVGRGDDQSYVVFVDSRPSEKSEKRLKVLKDSNDGFYIAEEDLKLRGPGDIFGVKQSGEMEFKLADIYTDIQVFKYASEDAKTFIDSGMEMSNNLKKRLENYTKMGFVM